MPRRPIPDIERQLLHIRLNWIAGLALKQESALELRPRLSVNHVLGGAQHACLTFRYYCIERVCSLVTRLHLTGDTPQQSDKNYAVLCLAFPWLPVPF
jgi:hypothetical protein